MVFTVNDIQNFTEKLSSDTPVDKISAFLSQLGQQLKKSNRQNISPYFLPNVEIAIFKLQDFFFEPNSKFLLKPQTQEVLIDVISDIQDICVILENKEEEERKGFYKEIMKLGFKVETLSSYLGTCLPTIILSQFIAN